MLALKDERSGQIHRISPGARISIGRSTPIDAPDIACDDQFVSRRHCEIEAAADGSSLLVRDASSYGTSINGRKVERSAAPARAGDTIVLGHEYTLTVVFLNEATF